ncbi:glycoside hydrolase family 78 protein [Zopfia rhizophila CBS 207.26]|uniref:Glycoside hydrolase family 78 protein n=1 Tax=Zopfia rhizophila CBS 207.26 TaxID=1314779 RepID=A0A6A6EHP9_9PEZI|nr:glycoside hydrolase family 78 protein [Zopfia rhizophila CBS 207.26]
MIVKRLARFTIIALEGALASPAVHSRTLKSADVFLPVGVGVGSAPQIQTGRFVPFTLDQIFSVATLDYGVERAGYPFFDVSSLSGPVQIEVKYSEPFDGLNHPFGDGPYCYSNQMGNSFRVETFNVTSKGRLASSLLQGGQKWQSMRLLTNGTISFSNVGYEATIDTIEPEGLPGQFSSDDETLNEIWKLGARAATAACVDKSTQKAIWEVDPVKGVFARSLRPSLSVKATSFANYTLEFDTKIERGGSWWSVAAPISGSAYTMLLTGELPENRRFANTNTTLTPPNTISLGYGVDFVNQTTLASWTLDVFKVPFPVRENTWYRISVSLSPSRYLSVSIGSTQVFNVSMTTYPLATGAFSGSFGFGAYQDQAAYFMNAHVYDTINGSTLYLNNLTNQDVLAEYGTQANIESVCLDGPKRDRLVWLGDFLHTARIIPVSTSRTDQARGTLQFLLDSQLPDGQLNISPNLGYELKSTATAFAPSGSFGLPDYQILGLISFHDHVRSSNDLDWAQSAWPQWQKQIDWLLRRINNSTGLVTLTGRFAFIGAIDGGSAVSCAAVQGLNGAADVATGLGDTQSATRYRTAAASLADAINARLWNDKSGAYGFSLADLEDISVMGTAFCITSGVASSNRTARSLAALSRLRLGPGYKDYTQLSSTDPTVNISPNTNGFLLSALFLGNASARAGELIKSLWSPMLPGTQARNKTAVGTSWEYVNSVTLQPGLSLFTSLSHPWGGAPTYILTEWVAGLRPAIGSKGFGYRRWIVAPETGVQIGLKSASAKVVTAYGGDLSVEWKVQSGKMHVNIRAPTGTDGCFVYGDKVVRLSSKSVYEFSVDIPV